MTKRSTDHESATLVVNRLYRRYAVGRTTSVVSYFVRFGGGEVVLRRTRPQMGP